MTPLLGTIEGFFGRSYTFPERTDLMRALAPVGYGFYLYAPKGEGRLRRRWREPFADDQMAVLADFAAACRSAGVAFGVGLSPYEAHFGFDGEARAALSAKIAQIDAVGCAFLAVLFDDMRGDIADLARRQIEIIEFAASRTAADRIAACPTYYSDDPVLDRVFGQRPEGYLADLGRGLDGSIDLMWTCEEVCSREFSLSHLEHVADLFGRRPFLWDNYPVNDGPRMSPHLHLRAFTGRPAAMADLVSAHGVNPASQATLTQIPMRTLAMSYGEGRAYAYGAAFEAAARAVCGDALAGRIVPDLLTLEDVGLNGLSDARLRSLTERYEAFDHPAAREIVSWLAGAYGQSGEALQTQ